MARNPKDIKQIVADSRQDMSDMQTSLAKLRGLAADDKTENALLRSRIDEQSQLIMVLKQKADGGTEKIQTLERIRDELEDFRDNAQFMLDQEIKKYNMLEARFNDLADNHQELIKFKDEYKRLNAQLMQQNAKLQEDNKNLFSQAIVEKEQEITELQKRIATKEDHVCEVNKKVQVLKDQNRELQEKLDEMGKEYKSREEKYKSDIKLLHSKVQEAEERLKSTTSKLNLQLDSKKNADLEATAREQQLRKEKDEMLDLAMQRGKLIQEKGTENMKLQKKIQEMEKAVRNMEEKFEREAATVNANLQVRKLRMELDEARDEVTDQQKAFEAYKKHTNTLLQKEKELNAKLRNLCG